MVIMIMESCCNFGENFFTILIIMLVHVNYFIFFDKIHFNTLPFKYVVLDGDEKLSTKKTFL